MDLSIERDEDDATLVARAQHGERQAFSTLVQRHQAAVYRVCYRILGDREDAADAAQEALLRAYNKLDTFQGRSAFKTWLLRLTVNVSLNERERRKSPPAVALDEAHAALTPGPEAEALRSEAASQLGQALRLLAPNHRAAVVLRDLEGLSYGEVAAVLAVPEGTAKGWAHRGRARLKDLLT